jgi:polar amino acid transport system substrate-binding protein
MIPMPVKPSPHTHVPAGARKMVSIKTILVVLVFASCSALTHAESVHMVTEILPPWQIQQDGQVNGIATQVVKATAKEAQVNYDIKVYPWARAYKLALEGENVLIFSIVRTREREPLFKWVGVIGSIQEYFYRHAERNDIQLQVLEDARKYTIAVPREDVRHQFLKKHNFSVYLVSNQTQALKMLLAGRGDLVLDDEMTLWYELRQLNLNPDSMQKVLFVPELSIDFEMAFSRETADALVQRFRRALVIVKQKGIYSRIMNPQRTSEDDDRDQ